MNLSSEYEQNDSPQESRPYQLWQFHRSANNLQRYNRSCRSILSCQIATTAKLELRRASSMKSSSCFSRPTRPALEETELATRIQFRFEQARVEDKPYTVLNIRLFGVQKDDWQHNGYCAPIWITSLRRNQQGPCATNRQYSSITTLVCSLAMAIGASFMSADTSSNTSFPTLSKQTQHYPSTGAGTVFTRAGTPSSRALFCLHCRGPGQAQRPPSPSEMQLEPGGPLLCRRCLVQ
jgi:hypothetical protein